MRYQADYESLQQHAVPARFHDAKLGIFVHWGLFSVPGWAPTTGDLGDVIAREGWEAWFTKNPYAEWYLNSIKIPGSPSHQYHVQAYGEHFDYDDFVPLFNQAVAQWEPDDSVYVTLLGTPRSNQITIEGLQAQPETTISVLGQPDELNWRRLDNKLQVALPARLAEAPAHAFEITPAPTPLGDRRGA